MNCIYFLIILLTNSTLFSFNYDKLINYINKNDLENIEQSLTNNDYDMLKDIFKKKDDFGNTPMLIAANKNLFDMVDLFLEHQNKNCININEFNKNKDTLLHILCKNNPHKISKNNEDTVINIDNDIDFADCSITNTELLLGKRTKINSNQKQINCIKKVLNHQHLSPQNIPNLQNNTPISFAIINNNNEIFDLFVPKLKLAIKNNDINNTELLNMLKNSVINSNKKAFDLLHKEADFSSINGVELLKIAIANLNLQNNNSIKIYKQIINSNKLHIDFTDKVTTEKKLLPEDIFKKILYPYIKNILSCNMAKPNQKYYIAICDAIELAIALKQDKIYKELINEYVTDYKNIKKIQANNNIINSLKNIVNLLHKDHKYLNKVINILSKLLFDGDINKNKDNIRYLINLKIDDDSYKIIAKNILDSKNFKELFLINNNNIINEKIFDIIDDGKYQSIVILKGFNMLNFYFEQFSKNYLRGNIENYFYNYIDSSQKIVDFFEIILFSCNQIEKCNKKVIEKLLKNNKDKIFVKNIQAANTQIIKQYINDNKLLSVDESLNILGSLQESYANKNFIKYFANYIESLKNQELEQEESLESEEEIVSYTKSKSIEEILYSLNNSIKDIKNIKNAFYEIIKNKNEEEIKNIINNNLLNQSNILDILVTFADMYIGQKNVSEIFVDVQDFIKELINLGGIPKITKESKYYQSIINLSSEIS